MLKEVSVNDWPAREHPAIWFARGAHAGQKYGEHAYVCHLQAVRKVLDDPAWSEAVTDDMRIAAWLHDVVEDTAVTTEMVGYHFGAGPQELAWAVTGEGKNRAERNANAAAKIRQHHAATGTAEAVMLKLADRIANAQASRYAWLVKHDTTHFKLYRRELPGFLAGLGINPLDGATEVDEIKYPEHVYRMVGRLMQTLS